VKLAQPANAVTAQKWQAQLLQPLQLLDRLPNPRLLPWLQVGALGVMSVLVELLLLSLLVVAAPLLLLLPATLVVLLLLLSLAPRPYLQPQLAAAVALLPSSQT
jgi:hypothetical protein